MEANCKGYEEREKEIVVKIVSIGANYDDPVVDMEAGSISVRGN
ncbi:hypothetical protein LYSBPC_26360 [Lysinibacillus piscis]|uniref:Alcohol dehydrogenase N-terminal domain-containing protein n=1 Tax=Lysinibacillus piscis TaxID=2518931 RepID=A0ABQ5NND7_9BACI|nr:hypothetical protein LYSBPC_26360 [Lysinibacillus sp. KH24]